MKGLIVKINKTAEWEPERQKKEDYDTSWKSLKKENFKKEDNN
jgi:hypothetical protein